MEGVVVGAVNEAADRLAGVMEQMHREGGGVVRYALSMPEEFLGLAQRAADGDYDADLLAEAWRRFRRAIDVLPRGQRQACPLCTRSLKPRRLAFVLAVPYGHDDPTCGVMFGICERCAPDRVKADAAAHRAVENLWPGMRPLGIPHEAGHA